MNFSTCKNWRFDNPETYLKFVALEPTRQELLEDIREGLLSIKRGDS